MAELILHYADVRVITKLTIQPRGVRKMLKRLLDPRPYFHANRLGLCIFAFLCPLVGFSVGLCMVGFSVRGLF